MDLKNKKVLLVGLGILGGGLSMADYLIKKGAHLTISDLRTEKELEAMVKKVKKIAAEHSQEVKIITGENPLSEIKKADLIILNPAVSAFSPLVKEIRRLGKNYYSDYSFFLKSIEIKKPEDRPQIIGITGTRGKTTVSSWAHHFIEGSILGGNIPEAGLLKILGKEATCYVLELSSYQLEHLTKSDPSPNIAILTNIYIDHLNRYKTLKRYAKVKKLIYANQTENDTLIISNDEPIVTDIEADKPKSKIYYISLKKLPKKKDGLYIDRNKIYQKNGTSIQCVGEVKDLAPHEKYNFMFAALAANLYGVSWNQIIKLSKSITNPTFRQEVIYRSNNLVIVNDSAGTSPEATMAAIEKYKNNNIYLVTGGTDKELDSKDLAKKIAKEIEPEKVFLLGGSATNNLIDNMPSKYLKTGKVREFQTLEDIIKVTSREIKNGALVFSPGAASFEKFKNEFDRGNQFNKLVERYFGKTNTKRNNKR
ncbi:UDP-N-acetylmuramoyl-L-alanine--D-glutamate ligase [Patescibacteria group bacterium]|nr:UDP-N-acetylmuramoyl-L-alanine--D-glutamate ligase [Patescibacteria group bacterium]